jgi:hypothetical protein
MIQVAGGILLAVLVMVLLPYILLSVSGIIVAAVALAAVGFAAWIVWSVSRSVAGTAASLRRNCAGTPAPSAAPCGQHTCTRTFFDSVLAPATMSGVTAAYEPTR